jgi:hypothetical protein
MRIPLPSSETQKISRRAVELIKTTAPKKTANAVNQITASWQDGVVDIVVPEGAEYILKYDQGEKERPITTVSDRVIPIREADGSIAFRRLKQNDVGKAPLVVRASDDGELTDGKPLWIKQAVPGEFFIERSVERSTMEWERSLTEDDPIKILQQTPLADDLNTILRSGKSM